MNQHALELEGLFETTECSCTNTNSLDLERVVYEQRALPHPSSTAVRFTNRQRGVQFQLDLTVTNALPAHASGLALQVIDSTQIWSNEVTGTIGYDDIVAITAVI